MSTVREERAFWLHQLHAGVLNTLGAAIMQTQVCEQAIRASLPSSLDELARLKQMLRILEEAARAMASGATRRPPDLLDEVRQRSQTFAQQHPGIDVALDITGDVSPVPERVAAGVGAVLAEALLNISRHAQAKRAEVHLSGMAGSLLLRVRDDGCGFNLGRAEVREPDAERPQCGLVIMREWAAVLAGRLAISSAAGRGTQVTLHVPIDLPRRRASRQSGRTS